MAEYIEREAALEMLNKSLSFCENELDLGAYRTGCIAAIQDDIGNIKHIPTADVAEVRHGEWETVHGVLTPGGDPLKRCPYCKSRESEHLDGIEYPSRWMFCPICGAKMDGKGEGE